MKPEIQHDIESDVVAQIEDMLSDSDFLLDNPDMTYDGMRAVALEQIVDALSHPENDESNRWQKLTYAKNQLQKVKFSA